VSSRKLKHDPPPLALVWAKLAWLAGGSVWKKEGGGGEGETRLRAQQNDWNPSCQAMAAQVMRGNASASRSRMKTLEKTLGVSHARGNFLKCILYLSCILVGRRVASSHIFIMWRGTPTVQTTSYYVCIPWTWGCTHSAMNVNTNKHSKDVKRKSNMEGLEGFLQNVPCRVNNMSDVLAETSVCGPLGKLKYLNMRKPLRFLH